MQIFLFGSAIYDSGEQFNRLLSDLDIVCLLPRDLSALERFKLMEHLREAKHDLEMRMIPSLGRENCSEPGVSVVVVTPFEVLANIHKSGARNFFDANFFLNLSNGSMQLSLIPEAGQRDLPDSRRQAFEFCQKTRNDYLARAANKRGGIKEYSGIPPLPKALMRSAAQIAPVDRDGQWYDTRLGLEHIRAILREARGLAPEFQVLDKKVSIRCGGNGIRSALTAEDQLLLSELLFDEVQRHGSVESVNWFMRVTSADYSPEAAAELYERIRSLTPQVKFRGAIPGSVILQLASQRAAFEMYATLQRLNALGEVLKADVSEVGIDNGNLTVTDNLRGRRMSTLVALIKQWRPVDTESWARTENHFVHELRRILDSTPVLEGATVEREVEFGRLEIPYRLDFLLVWPRDNSDDTPRIGIEVKFIRSKSSFFEVASQVSQIGGPMILVLVGSAIEFRKIEKDLAQLKHVKSNIEAVTVITD
ncbi:hypothetical protein [Pelomonas cellulosilytica]|uniref:Pol beta superfamily nucleotidyltransferase in conflict systems domain-containing protein n=1 Tax=Pelomonas cellulosilytica TaxID=2906762 RepID=A0ABS8XWL3_9BURK|nr:hypothetical protein [Pelomonas sp. P8]MCE4555021.1 hypothetical protein [Pelomonas sp. P8]